MRSFLIICCCVFTSIVQSQNFSSGWLPKVNLSTKISDNVKWVNSIEARETIYDQQLNLKHSLIDVTTIGAFDLGVNNKLNIGYLVRFKGDEIIHRFLQHYNWVSLLNDVKVAHRLGFEQFYQNHQTPKYRSRYRATLLKPLNGTEVNDNEYYLKLSNEYVYAFATDDLEIRVSPYLGHRINKNNKLELGLDYRLSQFLNANPKHRLWLRTTWYISL